jgi:hypothetical protein
MKLPRWLIALLFGSNIVVALGAAGWWWVTWPDRTAHEFIATLGDDGDDESWAKIVPEELDRRSIDFMLLLVKRDLILSKIEPQRRSLAELATGRGRFSAGGAARWRFTAERGRVHGVICDALYLPDQGIRDF